MSSVQNPSIIPLYRLVYRDSSIGLLGSIIPYNHQSTVVLNTADVIFPPLSSTQHPSVIRPGEAPQPRLVRPRRGAAAAMRQTPTADAAVLQSQVECRGRGAGELFPKKNQPNGPDMTR